MDQIHLKWYHTFVFLFQAALSLVDIVTDALTCKVYYGKEDYTWFALGVMFIIGPMTVTCLWSIVASTTRMLHNDDDRHGDTNAEAIFFRGIVLNVCLSCFCFGPSLHSLEMFIFCARNFQCLWQSKTGISITKEQGGLYYLYIHTMNMKMVEGLLESVPQLILQVYVMLKTEHIETIQIVSASISLLTLTWMVTTNEELREYTGFNHKFLHTVALFASNLALVASRSAAIIFFAVAFDKWLALVLGVHWVIIVFLGLVLWTSKRRQDILVFCFAYSVFYMFVFRSYMLKKIRGAVRLGRCQECAVTIFWHALFAAENATMITLYYINNLHDKKSYYMYEMVLVVAGTISGIAIKFLMWCFCFKGQAAEGPLEASRPATILLRKGRII